MASRWQSQDRVAQTLRLFNFVAQSLFVQPIPREDATLVMAVYTVRCCSQIHVTTAETDEITSNRTVSFYWRFIYMKNQILIYTSINDAHTDDMILLLQQEDVNVIRINTEEIPESIGISLRISNQNSDKMRVYILSNEKEIVADNIRSIWWRKPTWFAFPEKLDIQERHFISQEIHCTLQGLMNAADCLWISHPKSIRMASYKPEQLLRASKLGFNVPETLFSNRKDDLWLFYNDCNKEVVYKIIADQTMGAFRTFGLNPGAEITIVESRTHQISDDLFDLIGEYNLSPIQLQRMIRKKGEYRVTVVGNKVFSAEIVHRCNVEFLDWRSIEIKDMVIRKAQLPHELEALCLNMVKSYHLNYAAIDIIQSLDGTYFFLEINPNGQYGFIEMLAPEIPIGSAMKNLLLGR